MRAIIIESQDAQFSVDTTESWDIHWSPLDYHFGKVAVPSLKKEWMGEICVGVLNNMVFRLCFQQRVVFMFGEMTSIQPLKELLQIKKIYFWKKGSLSRTAQKKLHCKCFGDVPI